MCSCGLQSLAGAGPPAAATCTDSRIRTRPRRPLKSRAIPSRSKPSASGNGMTCDPTGAIAQTSASAVSSSCNSCADSRARRSGDTPAEGATGSAASRTCSTSGASAVKLRPPPASDTESR